MQNLILCITVIIPVCNGTYDWREEARKSAEKGIKWDTTVCGGRGRWYEELSKITGGICVPFKTAGNSSEMLRATALARGGAATMDAFMQQLLSVQMQK